MNASLIRAMLRAVPTLTAAQKNQAFEALPAARLRALVEQLDLHPKDRRAKESLAEALAGDLNPKPVRNGDGSIKHPGLDNHAMGTIFEELICRFNEDNNEEAEA